MALAGSGSARGATCAHGAHTHPIPALAHVVRTLEPALPRSVVVGRLELPDDHPHVEDLRYLRERRVIARGAEVDPMAPAVWQAALDVIAGWYDVAAPIAGDPADLARVGTDLDALLARVAPVLRPAALVAWTPEDARRIAFLGLVWNWSAYPRLIVTRPSDEVWDGAPRSAAARLATCAYDVSAYVGAVAPVAVDLFLAENRARMYLVGSEPDLPGAWPHEVPVGEEVDVFAFTHPLVAGLDAFSAVFVGDPAPVLTFVRLLPRVRTNLSPVGMRRILQTPSGR
ncbi:MAG: hypothetical protein ABR510_00830 [Trueperaceae bacterium]